MGYKIIRGGRDIQLGPLPPPIPSSSSSTGQEELALRRRGVRSGRVRGIQPGIGWRPIRRRAASEGSLSLMVVGSLNSKQIRRGIGGRGEHDCAGKGGGGGSGRFYREDLEGD